jgi:hypothetical protein
MLRTIACFAMLLLCGSACADKDDGDATVSSQKSPRVVPSSKFTGEELKVVRRLERYETSSGFAMSYRTARCVARGLVKELGIVRLRTGGFLTKDLRVSENWHMPPLDANTYADVWLACGD